MALGSSRRLAAASPELAALTLVKVVALRSGGAPRVIGRRAAQLHVTCRCLSAPYIGAADVNQSVVRRTTASRDFRRDTSHVRRVFGRMTIFMQRRMTSGLSARVLSPS
jgi:hypothetical protein